MIKFDRTEFILDDIKYGESTTVVTNVSNLSSDGVDLDVSNSSCSCTTGAIENRKLPPNGKTKFSITLNTAKAGKGLNQIKSISLKYVINRQQFSQVFRLKVNVI